MAEIGCRSESNKLERVIFALSKRETRTASKASHPNGEPVAALIIGMIPVSTSRAIAMIDPNNPPKPFQSDFA